MFQALLAAERAMAGQTLAKAVKAPAPERPGGKNAPCARAPREDEELDRRAAWLLSAVWPERHGVLRNLFSRYGDSFDWEDIISESLLRMLERADPGEIERPGGYLARTAYFLWLDKIKRLGTVEIEPIGGLEELGALGTVCEDPLPDRALAAQDEWRRIEAVLAAMPPGFGATIRRVRPDGMTLGEAAKAGQRSESAIEKQLARSVPLLRAALEPTISASAAQATEAAAKRIAGSNAARLRQLVTHLLEWETEKAGRAGALAFAAARRAAQQKRKRAPIETGTGQKRKSEEIKPKEMEQRSSGDAPRALTIEDIARLDLY